jgi:iron complex outermembrane receptor protein
MRKTGFLVIIFWLLTGSVFAQQDTCSYYVEGRVFDRATGEPLPFASVKIKGTELGTVADEEGRFRIEKLCIEEFDLIFSFVGYKNVLHHHDTYHKVPAIYMASDDMLLESIVVEGDYDALKMKTINVRSFDLKELSNSSTKNFGELVSSLSGVSMLNTGSNISKPIIHGLHSNRVLILNDEIRHEFQNWGTEHAPEIDPHNAEAVELVKGAATVRYGPDALGGVILMKPDQLELHTDLNGEFNTQLQSNGRGGSTSLQLQKGTDHFSFRVGGNYTRLGDQVTPNYILSNTGREEYSYQAGVRYHNGPFDLETTYSEFNQQLGILRASIVGNLLDLRQALESDRPLIERDFTYNIGNPRQEVRHQMVKVKSSYSWGNQALEARYGYQDNRRREFDVRRGTLNDRPSINLELQTHSLDVDWTHPSFGDVEGTAGFQWMYQDNDNIPGTNTVPFIPNFNNNRFGLYAVESLDRGASTFEAGLRYDFLYVSARGREPNNDIYRNEYTYQNFTGTLGWLYEIRDGLTFRSNIGSAWRPPNISELYSFGKRLYSVEYGLWRYEINEQGTVTTRGVQDQESQPVPSEVGYKWLNSLTGRQDRVQYELTGYLNIINNFIFQVPAGITNTVRGAFPYFIYKQEDAIFWGFDGDVRFNQSSAWTHTLSASYLWAGEAGNNDLFIGIPPANVNYAMTYRLPKELFGANVSINASAEYMFRQFREPRVLTPTQLLEAGANGDNIFTNNTSEFDLLPVPEGFLLLDADVSVNWTQSSLVLGGQNLLNTSYRFYTDHMRYFADQAGINIFLSYTYRL